MFISLLLCGAVIEELPNGRIDWTHTQLIVESSGGQNTGAWTDSKLVEQTAVSQLELRVEQSAMALPFDEERRAEDLAQDPSLGTALEEGLASWTIRETRYYSSGRVELEAQVDLQDWLRPVLVAEALGDPDAPTQPTEVSGVVVDARGLDLKPALAPKLLAPGNQEVLYSSASLTKETAAVAVPVIWVTDASDPEAIERAGDHPAFFDVEAVRGNTELILRAEDAAQLRTLAANTDLLRTARVVVVID